MTARLTSRQVWDVRMRVMVKVQDNREIPELIAGAHILQWDEKNVL